MPAIWQLRSGKVVENSNKVCHEVIKGLFVAPLVSCLHSLFSFPYDYAGQVYTFTVAEGANGQDGRISVNYDGFIDDVGVGDILLVDGGLQSLSIKEKKGKDVICQVVDGGVMTSRWCSSSHIVQGDWIVDWEMLSVATKVESRSGVSLIKIWSEQSELVEICYLSGILSFRTLALRYVHRRSRQVHFSVIAMKPWNLADDIWISEARAQICPLSPKRIGWIWSLASMLVSIIMPSPLSGMLRSYMSSSDISLNKVSLQRRHLQTRRSSNYYPRMKSWACCCRARLSFGQYYDNLCSASLNLHVHCTKCVKSQANKLLYVSLCCITQQRHLLEANYLRVLEMKLHPLFSHGNPRPHT